MAIAPPWTARARHNLRLIVAFSCLAMWNAGCSKEADTKETRLSRADGYFAAQQYDKAEKEYREALRLAPGDPVAQRQLGLIYFEQGQLRQAYPLLKKSSELEPDNPDVQLKLATGYFVGRDYKNARALAQQILEKQPGQLEALLLMVDTTVSPDDLQETRNAIDKLQGRENDRLTYHLARGAMELRNKDDRQAEIDFKAALDLAPKSSAAHLALGRLYLYRRDVTAATQAFESAAALSPPRSPIRLLYADLKLRSGATDEAKKFAEEMVRDAPDYLPSRAFLMKIVCSENRGDDCAARVDNVLAQDPLNSDALFQSGLLALGKGNNTLAIRIFTQLAGLNDKDPRVWYQLALAYLASMKDASPVAARNAFERADENLSIAVKLDPKFQQAVLLLADVKIRKGVPAAAQDLLIPFVKEQPQVAQAQYLLGAAYLAQQKPGDALEVYRHMAESFPKDPQPSFLAGRLLLAERRPAEARKALEKSLEASPIYAPAIELLVNLDLAEKQYAIALDRVQPLIEKDSNSAQAFGIRGKIYAAQADFSRAEADLLKAIELDPKLQPVYLLLAQLYIASNRQELSIAKLNEAIEKNKDNNTRTLPALMLLAQLQLNLARYDEARNTYEKLLAVSPNLSLALNNLAVLYSENLGQLDKAYDLAKKANEAAPNEPRIADTLGWIEFKRRNYANALRLLEDSAIKLPDSAEIQFHLGMAHYMMGDEAPARAALEKAVNASADFMGKDEARRRLAILSIDPGASNPTAQAELDTYLREHSGDPVALLRRAQMQERQGIPEQAIKTYETIVENNAQFTPALLRLAIAYARSNQLGKATDIAQKARQAHPDDPKVAATLGWVLFKNGEYDKALPLLRDSAAKLPDQAEAQFHLGMAHYILGEEEQARVALQNAVNATGDFPEKSEARQRLQVLSIPDAASSSTGARPQLENFLRENPNDPIALFRLARLQQHEGAVQQAIVAYENIIASNANFSPALRQLAVLYGSNAPQDLSKAFEISTRARQAFPDDPEIVKTLGILNYRRRFFPQAAEQLKSAATSRNQDAEVLYYLGETYNQLNQPKECQQAMEKALNLNLPAKLADDANRVRAACAQKSSVR